ncbi:Eco57I restriction-modification methylase domain-containing protein [Thermosynechococcaceae cyanobacterium BACA0444]|uniref:site-specific DNA-methyltransferase (adenine-specific) n=1 Tax=Pseudocalidococcus azoricus BACA0444 TaxID=2918990 RepID=A0AAE4JZL9_9CYAN|nr:Eco57I restriction-modification methylase domain-containing protein [Pseudocalidococcus azoricus]MDS3860982.1 Eco57I restriction-modification methylase domain-containing protein [Pseudocalidococcus azoricus BACA0444]
MAQRVKKAFDVEKVTKQFFKRFEQEHKQFLKFIEGIESDFDRAWYASLMLNRLMFVYFIQKKGFLDGDINYLKNRLQHCQQEWGTDTFHSFYRQFLLKLFHQGLGQSQRPPEITRLLGKIPYLNGGLFEVHQLEEKYDITLQIPDAAFERIFSFFDEYDWHLDDRPLRNQNEINPDVLGYIFEKFVNQKQMGAYYTKEDITEYISKNTIIPFLFNAAEKDCQIAFQSSGVIWALLSENPDRYLYPAVLHGVDLELPAEIAAGIEDVSQRGGWNKPAAEGFALPTETWREYVARRKRCLEIRQKLAAGDITQINDLITYNLNIRQFAQDVITSCESSDLLKAVYQAIEQVSILDPTCGSGAFLFAALNILEPLYSGCLERMQGFVDEDDFRLSQEPEAKPRYDYFRQVLSEMGKHPNPRYFVLKSIMLNNLYGVDIMEEATEICKLRLFLKLVSQIEPQPKKENFGLEPLPDIDFNIRSGNTLVGFTSLDEVCKAMAMDTQTGQGRLIFDDGVMNRVVNNAVAVDMEFKRFKSLQVQEHIDSAEISESKAILKKALTDLREELDRYLAEEYEKGLSKNSKRFQSWQVSHQPFHWFVEFYRIINQGGFDVIIGNPPYVEWSKINSYKVRAKHYLTESCGNIYTVICEKSYKIIHKNSAFGMIVPMSCISTERMQEFRNIWIANKFISYISNYSGDAHPSVLFEGVKFRLSILIQLQSSKSKIYSTHFYKWLSDAREELFPLIEYNEVLGHFVQNGLIPKITGKTYSSILNKCLTQKKRVRNIIIKENSYTVYSHRIVAHFVKAFDFIPFFSNERDGIKKSEDYKTFSVESETYRDALVAILNSNTFYIWFSFYSDVYHCGREIILDFPCNLKDLVQNSGHQLSSVVYRLMQDFQKHSIRRSIRYKTTGIVEYEEYYPRLSKSIIDEIDRVLAQHYGFTDEELDFIINYDIKYRMGRDSGGDE